MRYGRKSPKRTFKAKVSRKVAPKPPAGKKPEQPREAIRTVRYPTQAEIRLAIDVADAAKTIQLQMLGVTVDDNHLGRCHCVFEDFLGRFDAYYAEPALSSRYDPEVALRREKAKSVQDKEDT